MAALAATKTVPFKYAQRKDSIFLTATIADASDVKIELTADKLVMSCTAGGSSYASELEFIKALDTEKSTYKVLPNKIGFMLIKAVEEEEHWPRLLKDKAFEKTNVKIDWDKYVDEDEENGGFDADEMAGAQGMGGMGGMGGGMPGMGGGGMGGMPGGMDMASLMGGMGGGGGAGGMDMAAMQQMMAQMGGGAGGMPGMPDMGGDFGGDLGEEGDSDDEGALPDLDDDESENVD